MSAASWTRRGWLTGTSLAALGLVACRKGGGGGSQANDELRIVSLGGPLTEILFAIGLGESVVGVDLSSQYPAAAFDLPKVGYYRQFAVEGVIGLGPNIVVHSDAAAPASGLEQLRAAGIETYEVPDPKDFAGARKRIIDLAARFERPSEGEAVAAAFDEKLAAAKAKLPDGGAKPKVLFLYARGAGTLLVGGTGTVSELMIEAAGGENAVTAFPEFRPLSAEAVVAAAPEVILIPSRGLESIGGSKGLATQPGLGETPAVRNDRVVAVDDLALLGLGPRTGEALDELVGALHREQDA